MKSVSLLLLSVFLVVSFAELNVNWLYNDQYLSEWTNGFMAKGLTTVQSETTYATAVLDQSCDIYSHSAASWTIQVDQLSGAVALLSFGFVAGNCAEYASHNEFFMLGSEQCFIAGNPGPDYYYNNAHFGLFNTGYFYMNNEVQAFYSFGEGSTMKVHLDLETGYISYEMWDYVVPVFVDNFNRTTLETKWGGVVVPAVTLYASASYEVWIQVTAFDCIDKEPTNPPTTTTTSTTETETTSLLEATTQVPTNSRADGTNNSNDDVSLSAQQRTAIWMLLIFVVAFLCLFTVYFYFSFRHRLSEFGQITWCDLLLNELSVGEKLGLVIECVDVATDFMWGSNLVLLDERYDDNVYRVVGFLSLACGCLGLSLFWLKMQVTRKVFSKLASLRAAIKLCVSNGDLSAVSTLLREYRRRKVDSDMFSCLIVCFEDLPQITLITFVTLWRGGWDRVSLAAIAFSTLSCLVKFLKLIANASGCNDDVILHRSKDQNTENTKDIRDTDTLMGDGTTLPDAEHIKKSDTLEMEGCSEANTEAVVSGEPAIGQVVAAQSEEGENAGFEAESSSSSVSISEAHKTTLVNK